MAGTSGRRQVRGAFRGTLVKQIADGWEIVSCRAKQPWHALYMFLQMLVGNPDVAPVFSTATWTVRQTATGAVRKVTACSEQEAAEKIASSDFDAD
jgi:hypothetical protein